MSILFFDIDHTLLSHKTFTIPDSAMAALHQAKQNGHLLYLASGRGINGVAPYYDRSLFDGAISGSGACVTIGNERVIHHCFDAEDEEKLIVLGMKYHAGLSLQAYDRSWMSRRNIERIAGIRNVEQYVKRIDVFPIEDYQGEPLSKIDYFFFGDTEGEALLKEMPGSVDVCAVLSEATDYAGAEVTPKGVNKGAAMLELLDYLHIDRKDAYGFGDSENDIVLLETCGTGIAMGNAAPAVKEIADYVTSDIEEDGIYNAMKHFRLI